MRIHCTVFVPIPIPICHLPFAIHSFPLPSNFKQTCSSLGFGHFPLLTWLQFGSLLGISH
jgi:hypothetical protein